MITRTKIGTGQPSPTIANFTAFICRRDDMITYEDYLTNIGHSDITPEQEREMESREECKRRGIDPDEVCADGGVTAWMVIDQEWRTRPDRRCGCYVPGECDGSCTHPENWS